MRPAARSPSAMRSNRRSADVDAVRPARPAPRPAAAGRGPSPAAACSSAPAAASPCTAAKCCGPCTRKCSIARSTWSASSASRQRGQVLGEQGAARRPPWLAAAPRASGAGPAPSLGWRASPPRAASSASTSTRLRRAGRVVEPAVHRPERSRGSAAGRSGRRPAPSPTATWRNSSANRRVTGAGHVLGRRVPLARTRRLPGQVVGGSRSRRRAISASALRGPRLRQLDRRRLEALDALEGELQLAGLRVRARRRRR